MRTIYAFWQWATPTLKRQGCPEAVDQTTSGRADTSEHEAPTDETIH